MKRTVRLTESELINLIQRFIVEQDEPGYGKRCALGSNADNDGYDKAQMRQDRKDDKIRAKQEKRDEKESNKERAIAKSNLLNPKLNRYGDKMSDTEIANMNKAYNDFLSSNPSFKTENTGYKPEQAFAVFHKIAYGMNKNPAWYHHAKFKKQFNHEGPMSEKILYDYSKKFGNFDEFVNFLL